MVCRGDGFDWLVLGGLTRSCMRDKENGLRCPESALACSWGQFLVSELLDNLGMPMAPQNVTDGSA